MEYLYSSRGGRCSYAIGHSVIALEIRLTHSWVFRLSVHRLCQISNAGSLLDFPLLDKSEGMSVFGLILSLEFCKTVHQTSN
jgi:hypothetical protein